MSGLILSAEDARKLREMYAWWTSSERRRRHPVKQRNVAGSGGSPDCECPDWWHLLVFPDGGFPSSGGFTLGIKVLAPVEDDFEEQSTEVDINYNESLSGITSKFNAESIMKHNGNLICTIRGGPINSVAFAIGNLNFPRRIKELTIEGNSLDQGTPYIIPWGP